MFKSYLTIALRNLLKNKVFSLVNILGLAIGISACFFIFLYVHFERSYDRFHQNAPNLYRVNISYSGSFSNLAPMATNHPSLGPAMKADFPEVISFARVVNATLFGGAIMISYKGPDDKSIAFNEKKVFFADSSFFSLFSLPLVAGNAKAVLAKKNAVILSTSTSKKYFGSKNPLGQTVYINKLIPLIVTGVFEDVPEYAHIKYDMLVSLHTLEGFVPLENWAWPEFYNYVLLAPGANPKKVEAKFPAFIQKYVGPIMKQYNFGTHFHLQSVTDIHLNSTYLKEPETIGSQRDINFLTIIGLLILIVAWINYVNLTTAKSMERAREVGMRKVSGASKAQLITQFILESFLINLLAVLAAAVIVICCFPFFSEFIGKNISEEFLSSGLLHQPRFWFTVFGLFLLGAFMVGAYPAFVLIRYQPVLVLKGKFTQSMRGIFIRKALVSLQFVLSILLIAGTMVVYKQLSFMQNQELGYNKDQMLIIKGPIGTDSTFGLKVTAFKKELQKLTAINGVTGTTDIPGKLIAGQNKVRRANNGKTYNYITNIMGADENFVSTYQIELAAGRNFSVTDSANFYVKSQDTRILINEKVVKALGYKTNEEAIGQNVLFDFINFEHKAEIIGVVKSYHQRSLKEGFDPILYTYPAGDNWPYITVHINSKDLTQSLAAVKATYKSFFYDSPFEYFFLNDFFNDQYQADQRFGKVFNLFTWLAILVACLGLLGLSSFMSQLRAKEIGIRKVLGASVSNIVILFSRDYVKLVCLASIIAMPVIYFAANEWLQNYAFHIKLNWTLFILPPVLLLFIALITISIQSMRTAMANPVASIRTE